MRLSVFHPDQVDPQLLIDLNKIYAPIWPAAALSETALTALIEQTAPSLYVAMFNQRHIGACQLVINGQDASLIDFVVRDLTRRRGVGKYLLAQVEQVAQQQGAHKMLLNLNSVEQECSGFLAAMGYERHAGLWIKPLL